MTAAIDITTEQHKTLLTLLRRFIPNTAVWAYGSRVKWTARPNSDLDLVAFATPVQRAQVAELKDAIAESNIPFLVDLHVWDDVPERFHEIIRKEYAVVQGIEETRKDRDGRIQLREVCEKIGSGATPRGGKEAYKGGATSLIRSQNIYNEGFHRNGLVYIDDVQAAELRNVEVKANDVLLNITGDSVARCCQVAEDVLPARVNQHVAIIRPRPDSLDAQFLRYVLVSHEYQSRLLALASAGATRPALTKTMIEELDIPSPPIAEQKAIASVLGALDDKIELNRRINATLEAMARALFQSWFVDFDPVRAKLDGRQPADLDSKTAALFPDSFQDSSLGPIPNGWEVKTANEVSTVGIGKTPPRMEHHWFSESQSDVPWMSIRDLGVAGVFISHTSEFLTTEAVEKFRIKKIPDNTVVLSFKLTIGRVAITDGEMLSNEAIAHFRLNPEMHFGPAYLYCYLKGFGYDQLGSTSSIATAINSDMVRGIRILIPPKGIAEAFEQTIKPLFTQIKSIQNQCRTLATLRDTLLPKLLSGELDISSLTAS